MKIILIIALCGFALAYGQGYDTPQAKESKPIEGNNAAADEGVSGGQQGQNAPADDQEINHEWSFGGKTINRPEPPPSPRVRGDGPAPKSYPPLTPHGTNVADFGGKGGFEENSAGAAPPAETSHPNHSAPAPQKSDGYKH